MALVKGGSMIGGDRIVTGTDLSSPNAKAGGTDNAPANGVAAGGVSGTGSGIAGTGFTNLQSYINANPNAGQQLGASVTSDMNSSTAGLKSAADSAAANFKSQLGSEATRESGLTAPNQAVDYQGPTSGSISTDTGVTSAQQAGATNATSLGSTAGQQNTLGEKLGYNAQGSGYGVGRMNQALLGASTAGQGQINSALSNWNALQNYVVPGSTGADVTGGPTGMKYQEYLASQAAPQEAAQRAAAATQTSANTAAQKAIDDQTAAANAAQINADALDKLISGAQSTNPGPSVSQPALPTVGQTIQRDLGTVWQKTLVDPTKNITGALVNAANKNAGTVVDGAKSAVQNIVRFI